MATASAPDALAAALPDEFARLATRLPSVLRSLLVENVEPSRVKLDTVLEALGYSSASEAHDYPELRSLRLLRMAQGLPPEAPKRSLPVTTSRDLMRVTGLLGGDACAALRHAVDNKTVNSARDDYVDHLLARPFASQLDLDRSSLEALIGSDAVSALYALPDAFWQARYEDDEDGEAAGEDDEDGEDDEEDEPEVEISVRGYTPEVRPWIPFHADRAYATVNIALSNDDEHSGGHLLAIFDDAVQAIKRREGEATVHGPPLLHAVSRVAVGARYSLIMFFRPFK